MCHDLRIDQLGLQATSGRAGWCDGRPYSPGLPRLLATATIQYRKGEDLRAGLARPHRRPPVYEAGINKDKSDPLVFRLVCPADRIGADCSIHNPGQPPRTGAILVVLKRAKGANLLPICANKKGGHDPPGGRGVVHL